MAKVRIYQKPAGIPVNTSVFAVEILQNNIWYTRKVSWETLKGLIAGAESLVFNNGALTFTTPDGVAHPVLSVDSEVTPNSVNPVSSGAVSTALAGKQDTLTFDQVPTDGSTNPVESNGIFDALAGKQDTLTFDSTPTDGSTNPVTSAGIYAAISAITTSIDWKEAVATFADIATTYPNPQDGWTVTTLDDDHTYRYTGTEWVDMFSLITLATAEKDGLMSAADFAKLAGIEAQANKTVVDSALDASSTNPVQNKVIEQKFAGLFDVTETTDSTPYTKKVTQSGAYTEKLRKIIGATVVWNQLVRNGNFASTSNWSKNGGSATTYSVASNVATLTTSSTNGGIYQSIDLTANHIYYYRCDIKNSAGVSFGFSQFGRKSISSSDTRRTVAYVSKATTTSTSSHLDVYSSTSSANSIEVTNVMVLDLTAMFGSTIADYVNTLETQTAGSGIAWLKSYGFLLEAYYAYKAGSLQSVSVSAKINKDSNDQIISSKALDHTDLNGLFKLDANNNLYADGDEYMPDGSENVKFEKRAYQAGDESLPDAITDGTNTVVKLTTPTTATLTPYEKLQAIEPGGTEEFIDYGVQSGTRDVAIPAGNETAYGDNEDMGKIINYMTT